MIMTAINSEELVMIGFLCLSCTLGGLFFYFMRRSAPVHVVNTPEALTFKHHYCSLITAIQNPETVANILFAEKIIHCRVKEDIQAQTHTNSQKCELLLNAVERQIIADPSKFHVLVEVLQRENPTQFIAQQLLKTQAENSKHSGAPECRYQPTAISGRRSGLIGASVLALALLGQIAGLSLPLCVCITVTGTAVIIVLVGKYKSTVQLNVDEMEEYMPVVVDKEQSFSVRRLETTAIMMKSPPMLRYTGPCASLLFHKTQRFFIKQILTNNTRNVDQVTAKILKRSRCVDIHVIVLSYQALSKMRLQGRLDEADALFRLALDKCRSSKCENGVILEGKLLMHYASLMNIMGKHDRAFNCIDEAKVKLFNTAPSFERAGVIFQDILLRQEHGTPPGTTAVEKWSRETLEKHFEILVGYANFLEEYEKPAICHYLTCKAAFHLRSGQIMDDLPTKEDIPTKDDLQKAKACLEGVPLEVFPSRVNYYKAEYYLALSDLHLWKQEYPEAKVNARNAKQQFLQGKITNEKSCIPDKRLKLLKRLVASSERQ